MFRKYRELLPMAIFLCLILIFVAASAEVSWEGGEGRNGNQDNSYMLEASYVGSDNCKTCHEYKYENWSQTHNSVEFRPVSEELVIGDFSKTPTLEDASRGIPPITFELYHEEGTDVYTMDLNGVEFTVDWVMGLGYWTQRYMVDIENSTYLLPLQWNISSNKWAGYQMSDWYTTAGELKEIDWGFGNDPVKPISRNRSWQKNCAGCHTTAYTPTQNPNGEWVDNFSEAAIGCEACHGPGSSHISAPMAQKKDYIWRSGDSQICAQCHVRGTSLDGKHPFPVGMFPGDDISEHYIPSTDVYWPNGITAKEHHAQYLDWQVSGHSQEPSDAAYRAPCVNCHSTEGAKAIFDGELLTSVPDEVTWQIGCAACHDPHSARYEFDLRAPEKQLCITCHNSAGNVLPSSAHFSQFDLLTGQGGVGVIGELLMGGVVTCTDCHLPQVANSTLEWDVASHTFAPIVPGEGIEFNMPDSCTSNCHNSEGPGYTMDAETAGAVIDLWHGVIDNMLDYTGENLTLARNSILDAQARGEDPERLEKAEQLFIIAETNYDFIAHETSRGVHNFNYARALLFDSYEKSQEVMALLGGGIRSPVAVAGEDTIALVGQPVLFNGSASYDPKGTNLTYHWDFDDGQTSDLMNVNHTFDRYGIYRVSLTVTDEEGLNTTMTLNVFVMAVSPDLLDDLDRKTDELDELLSQKADEDDLGAKVGPWALALVLLVALAAVAFSYYQSYSELERLKDELDRKERERGER